LRFTNDLSALFAYQGYYFQNTDGFATDSYVVVNGISDGLGGLPPLKMAITASIPEPGCLLLCVGAGAAVLLRGRQSLS